MKDAKGHGSDAHQTGVSQIGNPAHVLTAQYKAAMEDYNARVAAEGGRYGTSRVTLPSGHELITSVKARQSNSRGSRRGGHLATTYHVIAPGEQFSKQIAVGKIKDHFRASRSES